jgi:signal peptidase II
MSEEAPPPAPSDEAPTPKSEVQADASPAATPPAPYRPNFAFLAIVSVVSLALDLGTKVWAKRTLELEDLPCHTKPAIVVIKDHFGFIFACNRGGAWGLLQNEPESIRRPFFLGISVAAILFIVSLYRKLTPQQWALRWGLPLVLGGALGNLVNRIQYNYVVDFIDVSGELIRKLNNLFKSSTNHWPTFNVADIAIVVGVGLMAIDMFTPRKAAEKTIVPSAAEKKSEEAPPPPPSGAEPKET